MLAPALVVWVVSLLMPLSSWQLGEKGVYKAINELDILLPWIQAYIQTIVWGTRRWLTTHHLYIKNRSLPKRPDKQLCAGCTTCLAAALPHWRRALAKKEQKEGPSRSFRVVMAAIPTFSTRAAPWTVTAWCASCPAHQLVASQAAPGHTAWAYLVLYYHMGEDLAMPCVTPVWLLFKVTWNTSEPPPLKYIYIYIYVKTYFIDM